MNKSKWTYSPDGDKFHPDWEHTYDGEYRPKGCTHTMDGDLVLPNGQITTQEKLDEARNNVDLSDWM